MATVSICCALCTSLLKVDALTSCVVGVADAILRAVLETEDRQEGDRDTADHDREDHDGDHELNEREPVLVERGSFESDPATHPTADDDQWVDDPPAAVHLGVAGLRICGKDGRECCVPYCAREDERRQGSTHSLSIRRFAKVLLLKERTAYVRLMQRIPLVLEFNPKPPGLDSANSHGLR